FDFLMPGYLYPYAQFRTQLETPISEGDTAALTRLQRMTGPFILRRKKENVLRELPEKISTIRYVELTPEQRLLYRAQEQQLRQHLLASSSQEVSREQIQVLAALTRLRQLCCTPELYLEGYHGGSGKVDACMELLDEAREAEHPTLVFSQFTTMLEALYAEAQRRGMRCLYLSGKDSKEKRRDMVDTFQSGGCDVFFLSLKAGGTGLNLTAADHVIHFDPWWNAAAEDQATDRAHRIGQDRTVFVTKLVTRNTIEERIVALQDAKREISEQVISGEEAFEGHITRELLLELLSEAG
ncbi:MAG: DEAD/DEAH box helicase, partial [Oscillospiraceae bacterium]|nr:DEAD/DEAH box helicase [Oscillospiraceae bacterium]